jgi:hypothetical protein
VPRSMPTGADAAIDRCQIWFPAIDARSAVMVGRFVALGYRLPGIGP